MRRQRNKTGFHRAGEMLVVVSLLVFLNGLMVWVVAASPFWFGVSQKTVAVVVMIVSPAIAGLALLVFLVDWIIGRFSKRTD